MLFKNHQLDISMLWTISLDPQLVGMNGFNIDIFSRNDSIEIDKVEI